MGAKNQQYVWDGGKVVVVLDNSVKNTSREDTAGKVEGKEAEVIGSDPR